MRVEVKLPQFGMGQDEGTILEWMVEVGERVNEGDVLAAIETAKGEGELEAPATGEIVEIVVAENETVQTGTVVAVIDAISG